MNKYQRAVLSGTWMVVMPWCHIRYGEVSCIYSVNEGECSGDQLMTDTDISSEGVMWSIESSYIQ
jgi:hypothetical protein